MLIFPCGYPRYHKHKTQLFLSFKGLALTEWEPGMWMLIDLGDRQRDLN